MQPAILLLLLGHDPARACGQVICQPTSTRSCLRALCSAFTNGLHVKRVLALSPDLDLTRLRNWTEWHRVVLGLVQVSCAVHLHSIHEALMAHRCI